MYLHTLLNLTPHSFIHYCASRPKLTYTKLPIALLPSYIIVPVAPNVHTPNCLSPLCPSPPYLRTLFCLLPPYFILYCDPLVPFVLIPWSTISKFMREKRLLNVCPSFRMYLLGSHGMDYCEVWYEGLRENCWEHPSVVKIGKKYEDLCKFCYCGRH